VKDGYYPFIGNLFSLINNRTKFLMKSRQKYGESFKMKLLNQTIIFILNPSDWTNVIRNQSFLFMGDTFSKTIFDMDHNFFGKSQLDIKLQGYFNQYLKNSDGLEKINNQLINQMFLFFKNEKARSIENKSQWIKSGLFQFSWNLLFHSITKTLFGDIQLESLRDNYRLFDSNIQFFFLLLPRWIYPLIFGNVLKCRSHLNKYWLNKIHENNESELIRDRTNLMIDNPEWFSEKDYSGEKTFLLWSSLSNTIPTLFWSLFHILQDKNIFEIVKEEIDKNFPCISLDNSKSIDFDDQWNLSKLMSCIYLESIINESLRLYSNPMIMRRASKNIKFYLKDGRILDIKDKDIIALYPNIAQNHSKYFSNPNQFIFDRFLNKTSDNFNGYLPFGSGKSMCPGRLFAKNAIRISIIMFLRFIHFQFNHFQRIPIEKRQRQGIGVSHPENEISFLFKYK
jgi:cytochrome P450